jgi:hypothetical protein
VAQLVAYYVRDVGAGSSSLLTPTKEEAFPAPAGGLYFFIALKACFLKQNEKIKTIMSEANERLLRLRRHLEVREARISGTSNLLTPTD